MQLTPVGVWCIGGNQGRRGAVSLDWYPFETERMPLGDLRIQWVVSIPDAEYPEQAPVDEPALHEAMNFLRESTT